MTTSDAPRTGQQILTLTGLPLLAQAVIQQASAASGVGSQVVRQMLPLMAGLVVASIVHMMLNQGTQPLLPHDDDIGHVLDYRKVRQIIIDECTAEHVNLLESLIGKLAHRLMRLPGVLGVRVRIAKLEIFEDCEVAIRMESGQW